MFNKSPADVAAIAVVVAVAAAVAVGDDDDGQLHASVRCLTLESRWVQRAFHWRVFPGTRAITRQYHDDDDNDDSVMRSGFIFSARLKVID